VLDGQLPKNNKNNSLNVIFAHFFNLQNIPKSVSTNNKSNERYIPEILSILKFGFFFMFSIKKITTKKPKNPEIIYCAKVRNGSAIVADPKINKKRKILVQLTNNT